MDLTTLERLPLWIGGKAVPAGTTRYGEVTNPATGEVVRHVPLGQCRRRRCRGAGGQRRAAGLARRAAAAPGAHPDALSRADGRTKEGPGADRHARARQDARRRRRARSRAASRSSSSPPASRICSKANSARTSAATSTAGRCGSRWASARGSRRSTFRRWCRCGCFRSRSPAATRSSSSRRSAIRRCRCAWRNCLRKPGVPAGVFNVVHGDKEAVDAILAHPGIKAVSFVGSTPIAKYIYETGARHGKRVQALGGAKNHAVVMPDADFDFATEALIGAAYGSAGERCMAVSVVVAVGSAGDAMLRAARGARAAGEGRRGHRCQRGDGPGHHVRRARPDHGLHRPRRGGRRDAGRRRPQAARPGLRERILRRPDAVRPRDAGHGDLSRRDLRPGARDRARRFAVRCDRPRSTPTRTPTAPRCSRDRATRRGGSSRTSTSGMLGINVPIPVPMAFYSFGGWKSSLFGDLHVHGHGRRALLHARQGDHRALARRRQRGAGVPHAVDGVGGSPAARSSTR